MVFRPVRAARVAVVGVLLAVGLGALPNTSDAAPAGFSIETMPFGGLIQPTGVEFAANGQVFVAERRGVIKVYDNVGDATSRETADLRLRVYNNGDRGLLGMVLDPQYPTRPYLWALYTKDAEPDGTVPKYGNATTDTDPCPVGGGANDCRVSAELSRLTLDPATGTWTGQEAVLLGGWCQQYGSHTIGTVVFGTDGYLYVGSGDAASYNAVDTGNLGTQRCSDASGWGGALRSQAARRPAGTPVVPHGAILRIDPDTGAAAPGNPYAGDADPVRQRIIAYGLRNPYPVHRSPRHERDLGRGRRVERLRGAEQGRRGRHGGELRLALLRGHRAPVRLRQREHAGLREPVHPGSRSRHAPEPLLRARPAARGRRLRDRGVVDLRSRLRVRGDVVPRGVPERCLLR